MEKIEKVVIWGAGNLGASRLLCELLNHRYEIIAYCDADPSKWGSVVNGYMVKSISELITLNSDNAFDVIVIAVYDAEIIASIRKTIEQRICPAGSIEVYAYSEIGSELESIYISQIHKTLDFTRYRINYKGQFGIWLDNIMSEVDYWVNMVAKPNARFHDSYCKRLNNSRFQSELAGNIDSLSGYLSHIKEPLVYDIGCGLVSQFGETMPDDSKISIVEIDPLAYFYNTVNAKYAPDSVYKKIVFGMFEYFSRFFDRDSADAVIINNALDHCIDPYKSILESLMVLKPGGMLYLYHTRAEGVNEKYYGLHQWNLDYTDEGDFIIWNYNAAVNVSQRLADIATIHLSHAGSSIQVELVKKKDFAVEQYVNTGDETENMAFIIKGLMEKLSDPEFNGVFHRMLMD